MQVIMCAILNEISGQSTPREWNTRYVYLGIVRVNQHTAHKHTDSPVHSAQAHSSTAHKHSNSLAHKHIVHQHTAHRHTSSPAHSTQAHQFTNGTLLSHKVFCTQTRVYTITAIPCRMWTSERPIHDFTFVSIFANRSVPILIYVISRL